MCEPTLEDDSTFFDSMVVDDMVKFKTESKVIVENRYNLIFDDKKDKVFSKDLFWRD